MDDKDPQRVYEDLRKVYNDQLAKFNNWITSNSKQAHTAEYRTYCEKFEGWEKEAKKKLVDMEAALRRPTAGPLGPESILGDLLKRVDEMRFLMAIMKMSTQDKTFLPALLEAHKKVQGQQPSISGSPVVYAQTPIKAPSAPYASMVTPYSIPPTPFISPQVVHIPANATSTIGAYSFPPPVVPVPSVPVSTIIASTIPHHAAPISANTPKPPQATPVISLPPPTVRVVSTSTYRPPSPVRDYNSVQLPFQDFSLK